jgi:iduronate 2-sulfatase
MKTPSLRILLSLSLISLGPLVSWSAKNILFIAIDDYKPLAGAYGIEKMHTPAIDQLAEQGTTFTNAHCQQAVCGPSRASLLTGMRPDYTRIWDLKTKIRDKRPDIVTLPQYFKEQWLPDGRGREDL